MKRKLRQLKSSSSTIVPPRRRRRRRRCRRRRNSCNSKDTFSADDMSVEQCVTQSSGSSPSTLQPFNSTAVPMIKLKRNSECISECLLDEENNIQNTSSSVRNNNNFLYASSENSSIDGREDTDDEEQHLFRPGT